MISLYLCTVRTIVLTTPLSAGSKTLSPLLHFRSHLFGWLLFFIESSEKLVKCRILNQATFDGNGFVPLKYEHFYCILAFRAASSKLGKSSLRSPPVLKIHSSFSIDLNSPCEAICFNSLTKLAPLASCRSAKSSEMSRERVSATSIEIPTSSKGVSYILASTSGLSVCSNSKLLLSLKSNPCLILLARCKQKGIEEFFKYW